MAGKQSPQWNPAQWIPRKLATFLRHVYKQASWAACDILGPHDGMIVAAQLRAEQNDKKSAAALRAAGVKTLGEVQNELDAKSATH